MPTAREFEDAAINFCLDQSGVGVWAMHVERLDLTTFDVVVRMGGRYQVQTDGVAVIRVTYHPHEQRFICRPAESFLPAITSVEDFVYLTS
jgi:hypothetical protein